MVKANISQQDFMSGRRRRVRRRVVDTDSGTPVDDARTDGGNRRPSRRVVLVPGSEDGTPQSIQDRVLDETQRVGTQLDSQLSDVLAASERDLGVDHQGQFLTSQWMTRTARMLAKSVMRCLMLPCVVGGSQCWRKKTQWNRVFHQCQAVLSGTKMMTRDR